MSHSSRRRISKYCCHNARGLARVTINGKDHYLGPYGSAESKDRYRQLVGEWLCSLASPHPGTLLPVFS